jgi:hypothetical protein
VGKPVETGTASTSVTRVQGREHDLKTQSARREADIKDQPITRKPFSPSDLTADRHRRARPSSGTTADFMSA